MRGLSQGFMDDLLEGHLYELLEKCQKDIDLDMQIRGDYINIYYKGNSLLKLSEMKQGPYDVYMDEKFRDGLDLPDKLSEKEDTKKFVENIPFIKENIIEHVIKENMFEHVNKENIIEHEKSPLEREYEQLIIRANNKDPKIENGYFIVDRQYTRGGKNGGPMDLTGFYLERKGRYQGQTVPLSFMELKYAKNLKKDSLLNQISKYYKVVAKNPRKISEEAEKIFKQKIELGLLKQEPDRLKLLKTLEFSRDINDFQFIIVHIDYNPGSSFMSGLKDGLKKLSFSNQIEVIEVGFALWKENMEALD